MISLLLTTLVPGLVIAIAGAIYTSGEVRVGIRRDRVRVGRYLLERGRELNVDAAAITALALEVGGKEVVSAEPRVG